MDHPGEVGGCQSVTDLLGELKQARWSERPGLLQLVFECAPLDVLEDEIGAEVGIVADVEDLHDVRVMKAGRCARLVLETVEEDLPHLGCEHEVAQDLERNRAVELRIVSQVDVPHRPRADEPFHLVATDLSRHYSHAVDLVDRDPSG